MSADLFERLLIWLDRHFTLTLFSRLCQPSSKPKLILSFDDGYADFIQVTMPILARHGIRVNQNVIPQCAETGLPPLNIMIADFIGKAPPEFVRRLDVPGFNAGDGERLWQRLDEFIKSRSQTEQEQLAEVLLPQFHAWEGFRPTAMMSVADIGRAAAAGHEIGAHSFAHASMAHETDSYLAEDVARCRDWFADRLDAKLAIYAFPNGSVRPGQAELVARCGIEHVLLLEEDFASGRSPHRRFSVSAEGAAEARFKALGRWRSPWAPALRREAACVHREPA